jgi:hypothetical protein
VAWPKEGTNTRPYPEWLELGATVEDALKRGMSQREVAAQLGRSQTWVSCLIRWYTAGTDPWYLRPRRPD